MSSVARVAKMSLLSVHSDTVIIRLASATKYADKGHSVNLGVDVGWESGRATGLRENRPLISLDHYSEPGSQILATMQW